MNMENETKQTKAYIYIPCLFSVYAVGAFSDHFFQAKFCLQFYMVKMCGKCAQNQEKGPFVHQRNWAGDNS